MNYTRNLTDIAAAEFVLPPVIVNVYISLFYLFCLWMKDNSYIDVTWGLLFIWANGSVIVYRMAAYGLATIPVRVWLNLVLIAMWGLRLSFHIGCRPRQGEDFRYAQWRKDWMAKGGKCYFECRSYWNTFILQGVLCIVFASASLYTSIFSMQGSFSQLQFLDYVGTAVWLIGFLFQVVGDR